MNNGRTICENRTLTHNLQQPTQKTNSHIYDNQPRKSAFYMSDLQEIRPLSFITVLEAKNNFCNNQPQMPRTWLITNSFSIFLSLLSI